MELREYSISEISTLKYGKMLAKEEFREKGFPVYSGYRITGYTDSFLYEEPMVIVVARGVGGTGDVKISPKKSWITNLSIVLDTNNELVDKYFLAALLNQDNLKAKLDSGASISQITINSLEPYKVSLPAVDVQRKASSLLKTYDQSIENNNRRIAILEEMAQSLYREWFVKFRFPGHENQKMVESQLGLIPEGWTISPLEATCQKITDGAHTSPKSVDFGVPMASVKDMHDFGLNLISCRHISEIDYKELERQDSVVKANDILVAKDGSYLKHTFVVKKDLKVALLSSIAIIRPSNKIKPHWLAYCLKSKNVKERMKQCVSGVAIPRIILKDFRSFPIVLPPYDLIALWEKNIKPMVEQCWNLCEQNENLKAQRDMLLPKLISGSITI